MQSTCAIFSTYVAFHKPRTGLSTNLRQLSQIRSSECLGSERFLDLLDLGAKANTKVGISILLRTGPNARNLDLDDVSAKYSPRICGLRSDSRAPAHG